MTGKRWVRYAFPRPTTDPFLREMDRMMYGDKPFQVDEGPKGAGLEVRLASDQETGMFGLKALPGPPPPLPPGVWMKYIYRTFRITPEEEALMRKGWRDVETKIGP